MMKKTILSAILLFVMAISMQAQNIAVHGTVISKSDGEPLIGFDHSILDIFVNDTWASSVRVFANAKSAENATAFADIDNQVKYIKAWNLIANTGNSGINDIKSDYSDFVLKAERG